MFQKSCFIRVMMYPLFLWLLPTPGFSQKVIERTSEKDRIEWYEQHVQMAKTSVLKNLEWQFTGPVNLSGRMTDVEVVRPKGTNYTIYVGCASGGVWKTQNEGTTWEPVFEHAMSTAIGDIALDPQDPNTLWVGTGEANIFRSSQAGAGIYRTRNGGETWQHMGLVNTNTLSRIILHPENQDIVYVAASGNEWTNNQERGVYKTTDGGQTWKKILYIDEQTGANDLIMDPENPNLLYASTWQRIRLKWNDPRNEADYTGSGIYKTIDGGNNWVPVNNGLPEAKYRGRIGIDLCRTKPNVLYAFIDNYQRLEENDGFAGQVDAYGRPSSGRIKGATVYRSDDYGASWRQVSEQNEYMEAISGTYGWVFGQIRVDPVNEDKVYVLGIYLHVSEDGGKTFRELPGMHVDHHGLWIDPDNPDYVVDVNDGGVAITYDGENFRTFYDNLPVVQFFNVSVDMADPFRVYGSVQDHGSYRGMVDLSRGRDNIPAVEFESAPGGEGSNHAVEPTNTELVYSAGFYGTLQMTDYASGETQNIMPPTPEGVDKLRGQWLAPFILSPHNPRILYHGTQFLHRSMNRGEKWEMISPDLSYNDPEKNGDIPYQTIFSIAESPLQFGLIYAGTDDGRVWVTKNSGTDWKEVTKGLPYRKWVAELVASRFDKATVYLVQNGKRDDDWAAYIWKSDNYGKTWKDISSTIPCGPVNVIKEDPENKNILYVGTDYGVYVSFNQGESWESLPGNLPTTYVHDLVIHPRDHMIVIGTHGRGIWALDAEPLRAVAARDQNASCTLLDIGETILPYGPERYFRRTAKPLRAAYYINDPGGVTVRVTDETGKTVRDLASPDCEGLNYARWDLRISEDELAEPGTYRLVINGVDFSEEKEFEVTQRERRNR